MSSERDDIKRLREELNSCKEARRRWEKRHKRRLHQILTLFSTAALIQNSSGTAEQLQHIADGIVKSRMFRRAIISHFGKRYRRIDVAYAGLNREEIARHKKQKPIPPSIWKEIFSEKYRVGNSYFIPHTSSLSQKLEGIKSHHYPSSRGNWHPDDMLFIPLCNSNGKIIGVISVDEPFDGKTPTSRSLDLLELFAREAANSIEREELRREIEHQKRYLEGLIESSSDIIVATNAKGKIAIFNRGAEEILGYTKEEIIGKDVTVLYESIEEARKVMRMMRQKDGSIRNYETIAVGKGGMKVPILLSTSILYDDTKTEIGTVGVSKDLREKKMMERRAAIRELAIGTSHHIKNQLEGIAVNQELLQQFVEKLDIGKRRGLIFILNRIRMAINEINRYTEWLANLPEEIDIEEYTGGLRMVEIPEEFSVEELIPLTPSAPREKRTKANLLVVDDEESIREGIAEFLSARGYSVKIAPDGEEAKNLLKGEPFDLVVTDIKMPKMNGYELFKFIKENYPDTPVIMMSAYGYDPGHILSKSIREGLKKEQVIFKKKPFNMDGLISQIENILTDKGQHL